jgi:hypothetical protein
LLALIPFVAVRADAQIIRGGMRLQEPAAWVSFSAALIQPWSVRDNVANRWEFGDGTQYGVALEKSVAGGTTVGLRGSRGRMSLRYTGPIGNDATFTTDADATVSQLMAMVHVASGRTFHSVLELSAGATRYSGFRARDTGEDLGSDSDTDFTFAFGYGLGYAFSPRFSLDVVQDLTTVLHQKTGLGAGDNSSARINGTRLVARFGLGGR